MDKIILGVLPADTPLVAAWVTMRARKQSALIRITDDQLHVVTAAQITNALRRRGKHISDVPDATAILCRAGSIEIGSKGIIRSPRSAKTVGSVRGLAQTAVNMNAHSDIPSSGYEFELVSLQFGEALLVTSQEIVVKALRAYPAGCVCARGTHDWEPWEAPDECPHDGTSVKCGE